MDPIISVIIPAFNEEKSIGKVVSDIDRNLVKHVVVVNNNSTDNTAENAKNAGAIVVNESNKGYGWACLRGIEKINTLKTDIVVFLDGDYSDYPQEIEHVISPIVNRGVDLVIGSRVLGKREKGSLTPQQIFGNWLATRLIRLFYGASFTDLGPFRAIKTDVLKNLSMSLAVLSGFSYIGK